MRRSIMLATLPGLVCAGVLWTAAPGCDLTTYTQATGYVRPYVDTFEPRQLQVTFVSGTIEGDVPGIIAPTGATVIGLSFNAGPPPMCLVETPLGYSLEEIITDLDLLSEVDFAVPNYIVHADAFGTHMLMSEDGTREVAWLREGGVDLQVLAYEFLVRVRGVRDGVSPGGVDIMDVESVVIVSDRVVQKGGMVTLVDRGGGDIVAILADDLRDEAWELVGTVAADIAITVTDGDLIVVTGSELLPSPASRAGGLSLRAASYAVVTTEPTARTAVTSALAALTYDPASHVWFVPIELAAGAVVTVPAEFDLAWESVTLDASGYVVFIDEAPGTAWPHTARVVFAKTDLTAPVILFGSDRPATSLRIKDAGGDAINGPWVIH